MSISAVNNNNGFTPQELTKRREELGLSQRYIAKKIGITPAYLSLMESGKRRITEHIANRLRQTFQLEDVRSRARRDAAWRAVMVAMKNPLLKALREKEGFHE